MTTPPIRARFKKYPPSGEGFAYFRIFCNTTFASGGRCPGELGHAYRLRFEKGKDPRDPASFSGPLGIPLEPGGIPIGAVAGIGGLAPELALHSLEPAYQEELPPEVWEDKERGLRIEYPPQVAIWYATHQLGYRWDEKAGYFVILKRHKHGLVGANAARRRTPAGLGKALEERIDPYGDYGFSDERVVLGDIPTLPAPIQCPRCSAVNAVLPPQIK